VCFESCLEILWVVVPDDTARPLWASAVHEP
jgi:hypothetical protein